MEMNLVRFLSYVALFRKTKENVYVVEFPDLTGCLTQGSTFVEAFRNAQEALAIYYQEKEGNLPQSTEISKIQEQYSDAIVQTILIDLDCYFVKSMEPVKKTLTIPKWLNEIAKKHKINYSQILKNGLIAYLKEQDDISEYDLRMLNG